MSYILTSTRIEKGYNHEIEKVTKTTEGIASEILESMKMSNLTELMQGGKVTSEITYRIKIDTDKFDEYKKQNESNFEKNKNLTRIIKEFEK